MTLLIILSKKQLKTSIKTLKINTKTHQFQPQNRRLGIWNLSFEI